jgi:hypothetical protein
MRTGITITYVLQDLLALVLGTTLVGIFVAQYPGVETALVPALVIAEIALLWLLSTSDRWRAGIHHNTASMAERRQSISHWTGSESRVAIHSHCLQFQSRVGKQTSEVTHNSDA